MSTNPTPHAAAGDGSRGGPKRSSVSEAVMRNALRYSMSSREYAALHKYVISRSRLLRRAAPSVPTVEKMIDGDRKQVGSEAGGGGSSSDYNATAIRHATRVFVATGLSLKMADVVSQRLWGSRKEYDAPDKFGRLQLEFC
jgi:hypothetical protein